MTIFFNMHPVLFQIGPVTFRTLGLFIAFAFLAAAFVLICQATKRKLNLDFISDHLISFVVATLFCSRLFFVVENWFKYSGDLLGIIKIQDGGFSFWGGVIGFLGILALWSYLKKSSFWNWFDIIVMSSMLGLSIAYIGLFFSGDGYGKPTDLSIAVTFDNPEVRYTDPVHPTQLYGAVLYFAIYVILLIIAGKKRNAGVLALVGMILFTFSCFVLNFFLGDRITIFAEFTVSQIVACLAFITAIVLLIIRSQIKYQNIIK